MTLAETIPDDPVHVCVLEDEAFIGEEICDEIQEHCPHGSARVFLTDNLEAARTAYREGRCDVLIADIVVKSRKDSPRPDGDAQDLLEEIKESGQFVPSIGHTAYRDKYARIKKRRLVDIAHDKHLSDSTDRVADSGIEIVRELHAFRNGLRTGLAALEDAANCDDTIDKQSYLEDCRRRFGELKPPAHAPKAYRRCTSWLSAFVMRLSAVPSARFNLLQVDTSLCQHLASLVRALCGRDFDYRRDALRLMMRLEALGYPVIMRVDI